MKSFGWVFVAAFLGGPILVLLLIGPQARLWMLWGPSLGFFAVFQTWYLTIQVRQRRAIRRAGFRICLHCRYSLADLPDQGTCPECGQGYTLEELRRSWSWTYSEP